MNTQTELAIKNLVKNDYNYLQVTKACDRYDRYNSKKLLLDKIKNICTMDDKRNVDWKVVVKFFTEMDNV